MPTSVVVTLLGAALTVWLAPALTRQWEDRQTARDLKARLAEDAAISAFQAIEVGSRLAESQGAFDLVDASWREAALKTEMKAKAYFAKPTVDGWNEAAQAVNYFLYVSDDVALGRIEAGYPRADGLTDAEYKRERIRLLLVDWVPALENPAYPSGLLASDEPKQRAQGMRVLKESLFATIENAADELLSAHPSGFSTTRGDLLRDLLP